EPDVRALVDDVARPRARQAPRRHAHRLEPGARRGHGRGRRRGHDAGRRDTPRGQLPRPRQEGGVRRLRVAGRHQARRRGLAARAARAGVEVLAQALVVLDGRDRARRRSRGGHVLRDPSGARRAAARRRGPRMVGARQVKTALVLSGATAALALGCQRELPPRGEALVIVDTDLPVPRIVNRLRVDLYTADRGTWYASREIPTLDPSEWPVSFSLYNPEGDEARTVVLRLRA